MFNKFYAKVAAVSAVVSSAGIAIFAHAQAFMVVPTSTAPALTASIGSQIADSGTLLIIGIAAGIPLTFYVIHQLIGLLPKSRGRRSN
jgi:hypothetical protein